ncbi:MAG TPA: HWE histidine kinase domain-containing protein [Stellaceae bacterium]|nr:HWE histidine kinase domain-containing protein [Stellaceae bacterium]
MLASPYPLVLWWGRHFAVIHNDEWAALAGAPPAGALGQPAEIHWPELWTIVGPSLRQVMADGKTIEADRLSGAFANIACSHMPILNGDGGVGGVLSAVRETAARESLRRERELLQSIVDTIPVMITLYEPDQKVLRVNREFERLLGWTADELSQVSLMDEIYPDPAYRAEVRAFMESFRPEWMDIRMRTRGGRPLETSWFNTKISDHTQVGIGIDITDRKRAEQQRTLLINELNHRVKNTLATVQSLAAQSMRGRGGVDARQRFEARLSALAQAHDLLTVEGWRGAALGDVVARALSPFRTGDSRIDVRGITVLLSPKQALAMSMALHELGTNALKYGALSNDSGRVRVAWQASDESDGETRIELVWDESGGPPVGAQPRKGFGSRLLERNLARELGGPTTIEFRPAGVICQISFPIEHQWLMTRPGPAAP